MLIKKVYIIAALCITTVTTFVSLASAADYPTRPVSLVVPYPAGGPTDNFARALAEALSKRWLQVVNVENRTGAQEIIASTYVAKSPSDGHIIFLAADPALSMNQFAYKKLPYDPEKDFAPVTQMTTAALALVVAKEFPANTLQELVALVKRNPGKYTVGNPGSLYYVIGDFLRANGAEMPIVSYNGLAPLLPDVITGRVDVALGGVSSVGAFLTSGKLKALVFTGRQRAKQLPDVPTIAESGAANVDMTFYNGLVVRAGTPQTTIDKIATDVREIISSPSFKDKNLDPFGLELVASSPETFAKFLVENRKLQANRFKLSGLPQN